ncbi:MAG: DNA translocase FtsK [Patescibacteria group bacterium]|nr:DNA translocase FtsK [Patescibacteria group bacterium]
MAKKDKNQKNKNNNGKPGKNSNGNGKKPERDPLFNGRLKRRIGGLVMVLLAIIVVFSFFQKAGPGGQNIFKGFYFFVGYTIFSLPVLLVLSALLLFKPQKRRVVLAVVFALILLILGISGILAIRNFDVKGGGWLGYLLARPLFKYFGLPVGVIVCLAMSAVGVLIFWEFMPKKQKEEKPAESKPEPVAVFQETKPKFEIKPVEIAPIAKESLAQADKKSLGKRGKPAKLSGEAVVPAVDSGYKAPPLSLLDVVDEKPTSGDTQANAQIIRRTLQNFGIDVEMAEINVGPTVAQYTLKPAEGVKLAKITSLNNDLALSLAAHPIRIEAPIPGRALVGIEVPNKTRAKITMGGLMGQTIFQNGPSLYLALGRDVMGSPIYVDLGAMPHLLVAGATGSGKTICLNSLIMSLIFRNSPKRLRLILIDPKRVEFPVYNALPHLLTPVILDSRKAVNALNWLVGEMERRFEVLREAGARDIASYNKIIVQQQKKGDLEAEMMPFIVLVIDELADLMMSRGKEVEAAIVRISQLARAVGIHLIVATQRPSVEVITGLIKANITSRVAFQVASQIDSRTILDTAGSEKLLGRGDMLFLSSEFSRPKRLQGGFVTSSEIKKVVDYIAKENTAEEQEEIVENGNTEGGAETTGLVSISGNGSSGIPTQEEITNFSAKDPLYEDARDVVLQYKKASASLLQRRLQIGYARAARLLDILEENNVIGPADGAKPREILVDGGNKDADGFRDPSEMEFE